MNIKFATILVATTTVLLQAEVALAYVGPGLGAGTLGVVLGLLGSVFLALFAVFWYPIKRRLKQVGLIKEDMQVEVEVETDAFKRAQETDQQ